MLRRLFAFLSLLSLLLCVATVVLWVRSYAWGDQLRWERVFNAVEQPTEERFWLIQQRGHANAGWLRSICAEPGVTVDDLSAHGWTQFEHITSTGLWNAAPHEARSLWNLLGFYYDHTISITAADLAPFRWTDEQVRVTIPHWFPAVLTAFLPAIWLMRLRRRRRLARVGLCPVCGYDLRASPGRCPECGAVPASMTQTV